MEILAYNQRKVDKMKKTLLILLLTFMIFTAACGNRSTTNNEIFHFSRIEMTDRNCGWAVGEGKIYRTIDSAKSWHEVTPKGASTIYSSFFLGPNAWVLSSDGVLYNTNNSGESWASENVPFSAGILFFIPSGNTFEGWMLKSYGPASGDEPVDVYKLVDGRWVLISKGEKVDDNKVKNNLPFEGEKTGFVFLPDGKTGFVTVQYRSPGKYGLYITKDSGFTWTEESLHISQKNSSILMKAPKVVNSSIVLTVCLENGSNTTTTFFDSDDKGKTWHKTASLETNGRVIDVYVLDKIHYYVLTDKNLYASDSESKWSNLSYPKNAFQIQFLNLKDGYALINSGRKTDILHTQDGGHLWAKP